jgi:hypothetical protein
MTNVARPDRTSDLCHTLASAVPRRVDLAAEVVAIVTGRTLHAAAEPRPATFIAALFAPF